MPKLYSKIAFPIIITGLFTIISVMALDYRNLPAGFYIVFSILLIYLVLFGISIGQNFASPIKKILDKASDLTGGNLKARIYLEEKDELGELAKVFNKVADELEQSRDKIEKIEKTVEVKVKARTQSFEETIESLEQKVKNRTLELQKIMTDFQNFQTQLKTKEEEATGLKNQIKSLEQELSASEQAQPNHSKKKT